MAAPPGASAAVQAWALGDLQLESGAVLPDVIVTFETWGVLSAAGDNAVLIEHALTGDSHVVGQRGDGQPTAGWWDGLIGAGAPLDPAHDFVVCVNVLGGCRGTSGPSSPHPEDGLPWGSRWPRVTIRDQVEVERRVADLLGVRDWRLVVGGSMGGMRVLEWVASHPRRVRTALAVATTPWATADQLAWGHAQSTAIRCDPNFHGGDYTVLGVAPTAGLGLARRIAHTTYRSAEELDSRFGLSPASATPPLHGGRFAVESYLDHHAAKLVDRFDANAYLVLTDAMATHDLTRGRGDLGSVLAAYDGLLHLAAVDSDRLFPVRLSELIVHAHPQARLQLIHSLAGHDGFLVERTQIDQVVRSVLAEVDTAQQRPLAAVR